MYVCLCACILMYTKSIQSVINAENIRPIQKSDGSI